MARTSTPSPNVPSTSRSRRTSRPAPHGLFLALTLFLTALAVGAPSATAAPAVRIGGTDRIDTAIQVARQYASRFAGGTAVLARADAYPDSLTATPLAAAFDAPLYLTPPRALDIRVLTAFRETGVRNVVLVGGSNALAPAIERTLADAGMTTRRIEGRDRYDTARRLADADAARERLGVTSTPAVVATGTAFADALAAGPLAARLRGVVLLSRGETLDEATLSVLKGGVTSRIVAVGGPATAATQAAGLTQTSYVGASRYDTAARVAREFGTPSTVVLASGETFADALAGGVLAAQLNAPLLLSQSTALPDPTRDLLLSARPEIIAVGGRHALTGSVLAAAELAATPPAPPAPTLDAAAIAAQARAKAFSATSVRLTSSGLSCGNPQRRTVVTIAGPLPTASAPNPGQRTVFDQAGQLYESVSIPSPVGPLLYLLPPSGVAYGPFPASSFSADSGIPALRSAMAAVLSDFGLAGSPLASAQRVSGGVLLTAESGATLLVGDDGFPVTGTSGGGTLTFSDWNGVASVTPPTGALSTPPSTAPPLPCGLASP